MSEAKRALVVDDDEATVALMRKILAADRWEVQSFTSGREALPLVKPGAFDLVVSDLHMPEMGGVELYEKSVMADPKLEHKFLFVSGYTDSSAATAFLLQTGCMGLRKPIRIEEFRALVAHIGEAKPLETAQLKGRWFTPDSQYLYSGEITGRHTLFSLLNRIYSARLTGVLSLKPGRVEKKLYFDFGNLIFAASNLPGDGLGEMMLMDGVLTQAQFEAATLRMERGERFGDCLVNLGVVTPPELNEWVRRQVTLIATSIFDYPAGRYYFFDTFGEDIVPEVGIAMPMGQFILCGLREAPDLPLEDLANDENLHIDLSPDPLLRLQDVELNETERLILLRLTRPQRALDALKECTAPREECVRGLYALMALGMVMAVAPGTARPDFAPIEAIPVEEAPPPPPPAPPAVAPPPKPAGPPVAAPAAAPPSRPAPPPAAPSPAPPVAPVAAAPDAAEFEKEMKRLLALADLGTHYQLLEVTANSDAGQIKKSYYTLARKFHPDRHMGHSDWIGSLQRLMEAFTTAYKTLGDEKARAKYDKQLAEGGAFAIGRSQTEKQETAGECLEKAKECLRGKNYAGSITWLRKCVDIAPNESKYRAMLARSLAAVPTYRQEAVSQYEKAVELDPWNTSALYQFAELFEEMKLPWRAIPLYKKILDIDPAHTKARERLRKLDATDARKESTATSLLGRLFKKA